jgi:hypothetical protein
MHICFVCTYMCVCMCVCMYVCMYVRVCVCVCLCVCVWFLHVYRLGLYINQSTFIPLYPCLFICLFIHEFIHLAIRLFITYLSYPFKHNNIQHELFCDSLVLNSFFFSSQTHAWAALGVTHTPKEAAEAQAASMRQELSTALASAAATNVALARAVGADFQVCNPNNLCFFFSCVFFSVFFSSTFFFKFKLLYLFIFIFYLSSFSLFLSSFEMGFMGFTSLYLSLSLSLSLFSFFLSRSHSLTHKNQAQHPHLFKAPSQSAAAARLRSRTPPPPTPHSTFGGKNTPGVKFAPSPLPRR